MNEELYEIYEGTEPYLFISYSHQDGEQVEPIIRGLQEMGYRLWYDTGIAVGSRWPDTIAEHLQESSCVVAFISANAMASDYCQEEIFFAMEEQKPIVAVHLEETMLPPGLKMRLSSRQAIFRYRFIDDKSFLRKLDREQVVKACKQTENFTFSNSISIPTYEQVASDPNVHSSLYDKMVKDRKSNDVPVAVEHTGKARVLSVYKLNNMGTFGSCMVLEGTMQLNGYALVKRNNSIAYSGKIQYLRHHRVSVDSIPAGKDCGIHIEGFEDIKEGDIIECYRYA